MTVPDGTIVLCHGFLGFEKLGPFSYFRGVKEELQRLGCKVIVPQVPRTGTIDERAKVLNREILGLLQFTPGVVPNVHLIGHSMGGLDARRLVYLPEYVNGSKYKVRSITTVSTPHHGSPIAEWQNKLGPFSRVPSKLILSMIGGSGGAVQDLRPARMAEFNKLYRDPYDPRQHTGIKYYSVTSKFTPWINHLFYLTHKYIRKSEGSDSRAFPDAYGPNDGMVAVSSAKWGQYLGTSEQDTSHIGIVGWGVTGIAAGDSLFDTDGLYKSLVENIAKNVEGK